MLRISLLLIALLVAATAVAQTPTDKPAAPAAQAPAATPEAPKKGPEKAIEAPAPALCPVTGKPIDRAFVTEYRDKKVYFATKEAMEAFGKDPEKYADKVAAQWEALKPLRVQVKCPVTGKPVDRKVFVMHDEEELYFADDAARKRWQEDPKAFVKPMKDCFTFQTNCLICGHDIDGTLSVEVDGRIIYLGCEGCREAILADKAAALKKLDEQIKPNQATWTRRETQRKLEMLKKMKDEKKPGAGAKPAGEPPSAEPKGAEPKKP